MKLVLLLFFVKTSESAGLPFFLSSNTCLTSYCGEYGAFVNNSVDPSTNPCQNFYKYSCGGWISKNRKPEYEVVWNNWHLIANRISKRVKHILEDNNVSNEPLKKAQAFYKACMEINKSKQLYLKELTLLIDHFGGWPLVLESWNGTNYNWLIHIAEITRLLDIHPIIKMYVNIDYQNTTQHTLYVDPSNTIIPRSILLHPESHISLLVKYKKWILETALHIFPGRRFFNLNSDAKEIIEFEIQLVKLSLQKKMRQKLLIEDLDSSTNQNWELIFNILFAKSDVNITLNDSVLFSTNYMKHLQLLISSTKPRIVANYIIWYIIKELSRDTTNYMRKLNFIMDNAVLGVQEDIPRSQECISKVNEYLSPTLVSKYTRLHLKSGVLTEVNQISQSIKVEFINMLKKNKWLSKKTKRLAVEKIISLKIIVGFPNWMKNESLIETMYKNVNMTKNHFVNILYLKRLAAMKKLEVLREPVNKILWPGSPLEVNGFYSLLQNSIIIPLGMLEDPFYNIERPMVFNYGALGSLIGHELAHALDTTGRHSDKYGNIRKWWQDVDIVSYETNIQCLEKQYTKYGGDVSHTLGENIADNVGMELSFKALIKKTSDIVKPHLENHTREQLFFISYAQVWCELPEINEHIQEEHAPVQIRVIGTMNNSKEFEKSFYCSSHNIKKCTLW